MILDLRPHWIWVGKNPKGKWTTGSHTSILLKCDSCNKEFEREYRKQIQLFKKRGKDICQKCVYQLPMSKRFKDSEQYSRKMSESTRGKIVSWEGKTWEERFGLEKAKQLKDNASKRVSGKNNPLYGKVNKNSDGRGYNGWYKNFFFRSLLELSYIIDCENKNLLLKCAENISIPYNNKTYHPDFILNKTIIELKPERLKSKNLEKFEAGKNFAIKNNLEYKILTEKDVNYLSKKEFLFMIKTGLVKPTNRTLKRVDG